MRRRTRVRSGVYNAWRPKLNARQQMRDVNRMMGRAGVMSVSEIDGPLARKIRQRGYGLHVNGTGIDTAVMWDRDRYKMQKALSVKLNDSTFGGIFRQRRAAGVLLVDRKTGQKFWQVSTHLAAGSEGGTARQKRLIQAEQIIAMNRLVHRLTKRGLPVFVSGDFNRGGANLKGVRNAERVDVMYSMYDGAKHLSSQVISDGSLNSDHGGIVSTFALPGKKRRKKKGGHKDGENEGPPVTNDTSAYALLEYLFQSWGLPVGNDIERIIKRAVKDGITPDQIELIIPDIQATNSWKQRFPGWHERIARGYNQITVEEYLSLEDAYHQIMESAGLPEGFYDDPSDFGNWIANDVSPDEIGSRVQLAVKTVQQVDPTARKLMAEFYGLTTGDIASYFLDQSRALPVIERQYASANVASWAARAGFGIDDMSRYESLVDAGVTAEQAAQSYGTIKSLTDTVGNLAGVYGEDYDQSDAEADVFLGQSEKRRRLLAQEGATFGGSSSGATGSAKRQSY